VFAPGLFTEPYCNASAEGLFESTGRADLHVGEHMRVGIERDSDVGVTQHLRDDLGVDVLREQQCRARVPEVMEGRFYEPRLAGGFAGSSHGARSGSLPERNVWRTSLSAENTTDPSATGTIVPSLVSGPACVGR
jgi:hypothetical protein